MIPVNFPNPPEGCTHKVLGGTSGCLMFFYKESTGELFDIRSGFWLHGKWDELKDLEVYGARVEPLTVELENK